MQSRRIDDSDDSDGDYVISTAFDFDCIVPDIDALNMDMDMDMMDADINSSSSSNFSTAKLGWRYAATEKLPQDAENHELLKHINLCPYLVNTEGPVPFLEYLLRKDTESSTIDFIHFALDVDSSSSVSDICESVLDIALDVFIMPPMTTKNTINTANRTTTTRTNTPKYKYKGTVECDGDLYLFYDCSDYHIGVHSMTSFNDIWIVTLDEIINTKQCCQYTIHASVPHFFLRNTAFLTLTAATNKRHTHHAPSIFYSGQSRHKTDMAATFGIPRVTCCWNDTNGIEMYKFTSYWTASIKAENQLWGVVRYAIFANNPMLVNNTNEKETNETETNNWRVENDSVLVYNDTTHTLQDVYVKHFSHIVPLTMHYLPA